jgi:hypothetical protein
MFNLLQYTHLYIMTLDRTLCGFDVSRYTVSKSQCFELLLIAMTVPVLSTLIYTNEVFYYIITLI